MQSAVIAVSDPRKHGDGINAYISYTVKVKTADAEEEVERRYNDFVWLHQHLSAEFSGLVIPPLPEKQVSGRFSAGFVESRRRALERFLSRTAAHEELHRSEHLQTFLRADSHAMRASKGTDKAAAKKPRGPMKWFSDAAAAVSSFGGASSARKSEADLEFEAVSEYIDRLEPQMQALFKHTQTLVRRGRDTAQGLFEFGLAFTLLSQSEQGRLRHGLEQMGITADQLSVLASEHADEEALAFEEPIHDYIRIVGAVKAALTSRQEKRLAYQAACTDHKSKESALVKARGQSSAGAKLAQLQADAQRAQTKVAETREEFEVVSARVLREVQRFNDSKRADFKTIVCEMVELQIKHAQKVEAAWQSLIPNLQAIQDEQQESD